MRSPLAALVLVLALILPAQAEAPAGFAVHGSVVDPGVDRAVEFATLVVREREEGNVVRRSATDANGVFNVEGLPAGSYELTYGLIGGIREATVPFTVDASHPAVDLGRLALNGEAAVKMEQVEVKARREAFYNSIDRKVYNVGKEIQSAAGSASDLLRNVPSVQVDLEGNVSLRGDGNVLILVNGKTSTMMGRNRAAVLEQMPADGIEKIEVITNPSAKFKPDGTAGIINLTLKQKTDAGTSGSVRAMAGNAGRYNGGVTASYNPGKYTLFVSASVRQDDRPRQTQDDRSHVDSATNRVVSTSQHTAEEARPFSRIAQLGADYKLTERTTLGGSVRYNYRDYLRHSTVTNLSRNAAGVITGDTDRLRTDPESEQDLEFSAKLQHAFAGEDREFNVEVRHGRTTEQEDNRYTNVYHTPARASTYDFTLIRTTETNTETSADYAHPLGDDSKFEAGYNGQISETDLDFRGAFLDAAGVTQADATRTNRFIYDASIQAFYGTFARKFGAFGVLAGLRFEHAGIDTNQVTTRLLGHNSYDRFYPSLHLSHHLTEAQQLQLNYSHRVHRPEGDDLNPFPEYQDPFNLRAGNPHLVPEDIHSIEAGWQHKQNDTTYLATLYYRNRYHGMTEVSRYINRTTLLTTKENLGSSRSGGLELGANTRVWQHLALNFSGNAYRNEIDASNLGFSARRSTFAWDAKLNASWDVTKATLIQCNSNYTAKRLTAQGYRYPTKVVNVGLRHNFADKKTSFIFTLSDVFNSLNERTHITTPDLSRDISRRRSTRIAYLGLIYTFGKPAKKPKKDDLQFDNSL